MYINVRIEALHWPATSTRSRPRSSQRCSPPGRAAPRGPPPSPSGDSTWCPDIYISPQLTPAPASSSSCLRSLIFLVWPSAACWLELEHLCWLGPAGWCHHPVTELPGHSGRTTSHNPHSDSDQSADDDMSSAWSTIPLSRMTLSREVPLLLETCSVFWIKNKLILQTIFQSSFDIVLLSSLQFLICIYTVDSTVSFSKDDFSQGAVS